MKRLNLSDVLNYDISILDKDFDDVLFNKAREIRKRVALRLIADDIINSWLEMDATRGMLNSILERNPFENTEEVLKFNMMVTQIACRDVLNDCNLPIIEQIGVYANIIELGAREFISPTNAGTVLKHLGAAKERGYFFTPPSVAIRMVGLSLANNPSAKVVFDPATGAGVFLAYQMLFNKSIEEVVGIELDSQTAQFALDLLSCIKKRIDREIRISIHCGDFFEVFESYKNESRFDIVIMNPPYGSIKFLASDLTDASTIANLSSQDRDHLGERLRQSTLEFSSKLRARFKPYGLGRGTLEYSKLFMAAALELVNQRGVVVAITPSSWLGDETSYEFRKTILESGFLREVWIIPEIAKLFKGVNQPTAITVLGKEKTAVIMVSNPVMRMVDAEWSSSSLNLKSVLSVSGERKKFPKCDEEGLKILVLLQKNGKIKDIPELVNARGELDLTQYKHFISAEDTGHRLIRGDHIHGWYLAEASESDKAGFVAFDQFMSAISGSAKSQYVHSSRIAIPQCSYLQKKERIEAAIIPSDCVLGNSCNFLSVTSDENRDEKELYYWLVMNSSVTEWQFRIFSYNNHISNKEIDELSCVRYDLLDADAKLFLSRLKTSNGRIEVEGDAFIASIAGLSEPEYLSILRSIEVDNIEQHLIEFRKFISEDKPMEIPHHTMPSLSQLDKEMISYVKPGGNWTSIPESVPSKRLDQIREMARTRGMVRTTYYGRLRYTQPAYTISTYFNRPGNGANIHPWEDRTLSCREAARLQSFPDSFVFDGNEASIRTQIGNAVPPLLGYAIGMAIKKKAGKAMPFCDVFAGAGGLSYGLELAGFEGVAALEINASAASTFAKNHSSSIHTIVGDINDTSVQEELITSVEAGIPKETDWVLVGGPPCQGFSTAGYRDPNDIRNKLVDSYLTIINRLHPSIVVMENVPGILSMSKGKVIEGVYSALLSLGYKTAIDPWQVDAERYGVPQMRKRVVIVAAKDESMLPQYPAPIFKKCMGRRKSEDMQLSFNDEPYPITVGEALLGLPALMPVNEFYPGQIDIDNTYSRWCKGEISVEKFLKKRGNQ